MDTKKATLRGNKFAGSERKVFDAKHEAFTPGPGSYLIDSSFGQYMDKNAFSVLSLNQTRNSFTVMSNGSKNVRSSKSRYSGLGLNPVGLLTASFG